MAFQNRHKHKLKSIIKVKAENCTAKKIMNTYVFEALIDLVSSVEQLVIPCHSSPQKDNDRSQRCVEYFKNNTFSGQNAMKTVQIKFPKEKRFMSYIRKIPLYLANL